MRSRFVISENDRRSILSMYGLLTEEELDYTFKGRVIGSDKNYSVFASILIQDENKTTIGGTKTDVNGSYTLKVKLDNTKVYTIVIRNTGEDEIRDEITDMKSLEQTKNFNFIKSKERKEVILRLFSSVSFLLDVKDTEGNEMTDYNLIVTSKNEEIFEKVIKEKKQELIFLSGGTEVNTQPINYREEKKINDTINIGGGGKLRFSVEKSGYITTNKKVEYNGKNSAVFMGEETDELGKSYWVKNSDYKKQGGTEKSQNNVVITISKIQTTIDLTLVDQYGDLIPNTNVNFKSKDGSIDEILTTDANGNLKVDANNWKTEIEYFIVIEKENYIRKIYNFTLQENKVNTLKVKVKLIKPREDKPKEKKVVTSKKIEFNTVPLYKATLNAYNDGIRKLFILVGMKNDDLTDKILRNLNRKDNKENINKINNQYYPLYYDVNSSDDSGYVSLNSILNINTYPYVAIVNIIDDPRRVKVDNNLNVDKIYRSMSDLENIDNLLIV